MKAVVFGGSGFLGSTLNHYLKNSHIEPFIFDNFSVGKKEFLENKFNYIEGDILDKDKISYFLTKINPDIVIHLAAIHHIPTAERDPCNTLKINLDGTCNILDVLEKSNFSGRFGFASTGGVYSDLNSKALIESDELNPIGIYTLSKYYCEKTIQYYKTKRSCKFKPTNFRLFNLVGKNETNDHLLPAILNQLLKGNVIKHGNLLPKRDYIHVNDASSLISKWASHKVDETPNALNVCSNKQYSVEEVITICSETTNINCVLEIDNSRVRKSDRLNQKGDLSLAKSLYNWQPKYDIYDGISDLWNDIKKKNL